MNIVDRARTLRRTIENLAISMDDETALSNTELFPQWETNKSYSVDTRVRYEDALYKCLIAHTSQDDWTPLNAVSLWAKVLIPQPDVISEWEQPLSTNPYMAGDKVRHNGKIWVSAIDNNVWEPGVYGWDEV